MIGCTFGVCAGIPLSEGNVRSVVALSDLSEMESMDKSFSWLYLVVLGLLGFVCFVSGLYFELIHTLWSLTVFFWMSNAYHADKLNSLYAFMLQKEMRREDVTTDSAEQTIDGQGITAVNSGGQVSGEHRLSEVGGHIAEYKDSMRNTLLSLLVIAICIVLIGITYALLFFTGVVL